MNQVEAELTYCVDDGTMPVNETKDAVTKMPTYSGNYDRHVMPIHDGRSWDKPINIEVSGFELVEHKTAMQDFLDSEELQSVYYPEMEALVKKHTGASRVVIFDHTIRTGNDDKRAEKLLREPVLRVHNDYTEWSGPQRIRDVLPDEAEELLKKRCAVVQVWRPIQDVLQTNPLAFCDARSLPESDLIIAERRYPDRVGQTYQIKHNDNHEWFYYPEMKRDEAIVFKVWDSAKDGRARMTAHTSFDDPTTPEGAPPRESIEIRTLAFFD
ncbi:MAG: methyltransferase [Rhodospirillaceae bacterium]|jgi:hypothetical protein|nr:methyltransferase [Rhodospirillaceae bacterium]MBT5939664.1 methyltransferase [Rhodospirillaceae bacterium]MBT7267789.1 methyltransferase [Rhodospirillaceae bacterium]